jgi:hypothetical protein
MKKITEMFTDEEKKQLSYLGSMLRNEPTEEEAEQQRILDAMDSPEWAQPIASKDVERQGKS